MYILDTNVISEIRKAKSNRADTNVISWANSTPSSEMFVSAITILELEMGVLAKQRKDPEQGNILRAWVDNHVMIAFADRILPFDTAVAQRCAKLHIPDPKSDRDAMIGATALTHGMSLVTRNVADFQWMNLDIINPWENL